MLLVLVRQERDGRHSGARPVRVGNLGMRRGEADRRVAPVRGPRRRILTWIGMVLLGLGLAACAPGGPGADTGDIPEGGVLALRLDGMINPISARYLVRGMDDAAAAGAALLLIELDTPGGLVDSTQEITARMLRDDIPIAVYVTPPGERAASAGVFVTIAAHVAAMAPNTRIGAATPISSDGSEIPEDSRRKIINDTVAYARSLADARGRNADWAEDAVVDAVVVDAATAVELGVVDLVASDRASLLDEIDGRTVALRGGEIPLETAEAPVVEREMSIFEQLFMAIADPNIALLLLSLGGLAIYFELANPGGFVPGIAGIIMLVLAFISLGALPISYAGLALIGLGLVLLGAEIFVASSGVLGFAGVLAFALGAFLLIDEQEAPFLEVSRPLILGLTVGLGAFVLVVIRGMLNVRKRAPAIGSDDLVGRLAAVRAGGEVFVAGELWRAERDDGAVLPPPGSRVRVTGRRGLTLIVHPEPESADEAATAGGSSWT